MFSIKRGSPIFLCLFLAALVLAQVFGQGVVSAQTQAQEGEEEIIPPLFPGLVWENLGVLEKDVFAYGQSWVLAGEMFKAVKNGRPDDIFEFYSSENLESLGWVFVGGSGLDLTYRNPSGRYLTVKIEECQDFENSFCVTVWQSLDPYDQAPDDVSAAAVPFYKTHPLNGAVISLPDTSYYLLRWSDAAKADTDKYQYCIDETNNSQCDGDNWVDRNSLYSGGPGDIIVSAGHTYYWQVRLRDAQIYADNGTWFSFTVQSSTSAFTKIAPSNGGTIPPPSTSYKLLRWSSVSQAATDRYQYCIDETNNSQCDNGNWVTRNSLYSGGPYDITVLPGHTYYWQVRLRDAGTYANNGSWWSFRIYDIYTRTSMSIGWHDGFILESTETSGAGGTKNNGASLLRVGDDAANRQYRAILSFNTTLPANAVITGAALKFKFAGRTGALPFSTHGNLLADARKGAFGDKPALQLGDFRAASSQNGLFSFTDSRVNGWYIKQFNAAQFQYINRSGVTQFRLRFKLDDNNDLGADFLKIYSGNAGVENRPQLVIQYYVP